MQNQTTQKAHRLGIERSYTYYPVPGGFETVNGKADYVRPIYAPHLHDKLGGPRYLYYLGDRPKLVLSNVSDGNSNVSMMRHGHLFLGIRGGKWLHGMDRIVSRYVYGHEEYELEDDSFEGKICLTFTRARKLDAMVISVKLPEALAGRLVVAVAGQQGRPGCQPVGGNSEMLEFVPEDTKGCRVWTKDGVFGIVNGAGSRAAADAGEKTDGTVDAVGEKRGIDFCGAASVPFSCAVHDAREWESVLEASLTGEGADCACGRSASGTDTDAVGAAPDGTETESGFTLSKESTDYPLLTLSQTGPERELYFLLTTEKSDNPWLADFSQKAKELFEDGIAYYKEIAETIRVKTPEPYLNSAIATQMVGLDASWDAPVVCHGPIAWHNGQAGWRGMYGFVTAGWGERVKENVRQYRKTQQENGRIENYPTGDNRYNMGEVLVDELLHYWLWSGDDEFFREEGYDFVAGHLRFQDSYIRVPGTELYENWLDAWNTDNKWNNGGPGSIATAYTWHACTVMAELAEKLGKEQDAVFYRKKADAIKAQMKEVLWCADKGVYGEYRDVFGLKRLHDAPDLSSVYTPIDMGIADELEAYQMLRYTDYAIDSVEMDGCEFKYSSNWLPLFYSSCGLYPEEVANNALAWFQAGYADKGWQQYLACIIPLVNGRAAGPGACAHTMNDRLENTGHIDFADACAQYSRTAVEGLFGISMLRPFGKARIMPGFPEGWERASIETDYLSYEWEKSGQSERFRIKAPEALRFELHVPVRSASVKSVTVNGKKTAFTVNRFACFTTDALTEADVEIVWGESAPAGIEGAKTARVGEKYHLHADGEILRFIDPQGVIEKVLAGGAVAQGAAETPSALPAADAVLTLGKKSGFHTFFAEVKKEDMTAILPVDVRIDDPAESLRQTGALGALFPEGQARWHTVSLDGAVNQKLRTLHENSYDLTWEGEEHFVLPKFYFVRDTTRSVTATGRSWWEDTSRGKNGVPETLALPERGGMYRTDVGIPFLISGQDGKDSAFVSLYNQFPDSIYLPLEEYGERVYVMLCASTNSMQSRIENARLTVYLEGGEKEELPLVNPDNIDDWLCYQERHESDWHDSSAAKAYAQNGYCQYFGEKAHANVLAVDLHRNRKITGVELTCLSNEVLVGLLGVTVMERTKKTV